MMNILIYWRILNDKFLHGCFLLISNTAFRVSADYVGADDFKKAIAELEFIGRKDELLCVQRLFGSVVAGRLFQIISRLATGQSAH